MNKRHFLCAAVAFFALVISASAWARTKYVYVYGWVHDSSRDTNGYGSHDKYFLPDKVIDPGDVNADEVIRRFKRAIRNSTGITELDVRWSDAGNDPGLADDHRLKQIDKLRGEGNSVVVVPW